MKLNRAELRKVLYDFNSISNRLMQADFQDYNIALLKFIEFIKNNELIYEYIKECGECDKDLDTEFKKVSGSYGREIFSLGSLDEEEIRNVFAILNYIVENEISVHGGVAFGYSNSRSFQDKVKGFNDRVVMVLIRHIERFLTKIGIDMGLDESIKYSITVESGQVNIASDSSVINATNTINIVDLKKLDKLIEDIKEKAEGISVEDEDILVSSIDVIEDELKASNPRKSYLKTAARGLQTIKGTVEFAAAITALIQFIQPLL